MGEELVLLSVELNWYKKKPSYIGNARTLEEALIH